MSNIGGVIGFCAFIFILLVILTLTNKERYEEKNSTETGLIIAKVIPSFIIFSLFVSSIDQMTKQCSGKGGPALKELRHNRFDRPYMAPQGIFQTFFSDFFSPFRRFNRETGLQTYYGNQSVNYFYRKTNDQSGDYASDVFIESWVWYRQMLFKVAMFLGKIMNLKKLVKYTAGAGMAKTDEDGKTRYMKISFLGSGFRYLLVTSLLIVGIPYLTEVVTLLPLIPGIAGMLGTLVASLRVSIFMKPFFILIIFIWIIPAFILFLVQYVHALYVMFTSGIGKKEGFSFRIVFMLLVKRFGLWYILLSPFIMALLPYPLTYETGKVIDKKTKGEPDPEFGGDDDDDEYNGEDIWVRGLVACLSLFSMWFIIVFIIFPIVLLSNYKSEFNKISTSDSLINAWSLSIYILVPSFFGRYNNITKEVVDTYKDFPIIQEYYNKILKPYE